MLVKHAGLGSSASSPSFRSQKDQLSGQGRLLRDQRVQQIFVLGQDVAVRLQHRPTGFLHHTWLQTQHCFRNNMRQSYYSNTTWRDLATALVCFTWCFLSSVWDIEENLSRTSSMVSKGPSFWKLEQILSPEAVGVMHLCKDLQQVVLVQHVFHRCIHLFHQGFQAEAICQLPHFQIEFHGPNLKGIGQDEMEDSLHDVVGHIGIPSEVHFSISRLLPFLRCQHRSKIFAARHQKALVEEERRAFSQTEAKHLSFGGEIQPSEEGLWRLWRWLDIRKVVDYTRDLQGTTWTHIVSQPVATEHVVPASIISFFAEGELVLAINVWFVSLKTFYRDCIAHVWTSPVVS